MNEKKDTAKKLREKKKEENKNTPLTLEASLYYYVSEGKATLGRARSSL